MLVNLSDGSSVNIEEGATALSLAAFLGEASLRSAIAAEINGKTKELSTVLADGDAVKLLTLKDEEGLRVYRIACAHVLAQAVKNIYPTCNIAAERAHNSGFYCDVEFKTPIKKEDLSKIEREMKSIIKSDLPVERFTLDKKDALKLLKKFGEKYKLQTVERIPDGVPVSFYKQGAFTDVCGEAHVLSTGRIKAFALTRLSGAYFGGDANNEMLTRISGVAFEKKSEIDAYLKNKEEQKKLDHRYIGANLNYFARFAPAGRGKIILTEKGAATLRALIDIFEREEVLSGYSPVKTPSVYGAEAYAGGFTERYKKNLLTVNAGGKRQPQVLTPVTFPAKFALYAAGLKSYKDLPVKYFETGETFKRTGGKTDGLKGLSEYTTNDCAVFCAPEAAEKEFYAALCDCVRTLNKIGFTDLIFKFDKCDPTIKNKFVTAKREWENAQKIIKSALDGNGIAYEEVAGGAEYYAPKVEVAVKDVFGKVYALSSVTLDFITPKKYGLKYVSKSGEKKYVCSVRAAAAISFERIIALLIEKNGGDMPAQFAPCQVAVLSAGDCGFAESVYKELMLFGVRAKPYFSVAPLKARVKLALAEKTPYLIVAGKKESETGLLSVKKRGDSEIYKLTLAEVIKEIKKSN